MQNATCDLSMIVDAAGGTGTVFQPHMMAVEKGEPDRHELLKSKCTFTKVRLKFITIMFNLSFRFTVSVQLL